MLDDGATIAEPAGRFESHIFDGQGTQPSAMRWYRVFGPGVDEPLAEWSRNNTLGNTYFCRDALGSVTLVTDANGKVLYRQSYTPFGERTIEGFTYNSTATRFGFTGREHAVGPYMYYRARHYDASTGRFLQADTYEGTETSPPSLNRYSYAYNNPVRYTDPGGHGFFPIVGIGSLLGLLGLSVLGGLAGAVFILLALLILGTVIDCLNPRNEAFFDCAMALLVAIFRVPTGLAELAATLSDVRDSIRLLFSGDLDFEAWILYFFGVIGIGALAILAAVGIALVPGGAIVAGILAVFTAVKLAQLLRLERNSILAAQSSGAV